MLDKNQIDMSGKVALVTGAGNGIGSASAISFARAGAKVAVVDMSEEAGKETVASITKLGAQAIFIRCDVTSEKDVARMVQETIDHFGRLDFAHNNVGISPDTGTTEQCSLELWDNILTVNLTSTWLCMKHELAAMRDNDSGAIVNTGSAASLRAYPQLSAYVASKHGLIGLSKVAALEYADKNIRVNVICPGMTMTPMLKKKADDGYFDLEEAAKGSPMKRFGSPEEVASAAVWLCSEHASFVTGSVLSVDGGMELL